MEMQVNLAYVSVSVTVNQGQANGTLPDDEDNCTNVYETVGENT